MKNTSFFFRLLLAVIAGEVTLVLLSAFVQEVLFDGIFWTKSSVAQLIVGGSLTVLAAVASGWVAMWVAKKESYIPHLIISLLVSIETIWLVRTHQTPDPAWFDGLAGLSLVAGIWLGGWWCLKKGNLFKRLLTNN